MSENTKIKYYSLKNILSKKAQYNVIFGKRSNGKTYATLLHGLREYISQGAEMAYIRRYDIDIRGKRAATLFDAIAASGAIKKASNGVWTDIFYYGSKWYLCRYNEDDNGNRERITDEKPFCYGFALNNMEHDKSTSYPRIKNIIFDEFLSRSGYIPEEFILFMNVISTIARLRTDVKIFMLGNTVNKYCPYFAEMGLKKIKEQKPGTIDLYRYGDTELKVAVEYTASNTGATGSKGNVLFAFNNPRLQMITKGDWEIDIYPHLPYKYKSEDIIYTYFIKFDGEILQCEIIRRGEDPKGNIIDAPITYVHIKTTDIQNEKKDIIFTPEVNPRYNHYTKITNAVDKRTEKILKYFRRDKVFFQNNEVGEIFNNYLIWCGKNI